VQNREYEKSVDVPRAVLEVFNSPIPNTLPFRKDEGNEERNYKRQRKSGRAKDKEDTIQDQMQDHDLESNRYEREGRS
jgi:hypothetical protein